uniref:Centrosome and spindle pole-associated protein 1 C-terminal domain-containing protein n=1 Tax=Anabas testudineus TaxID=64144 RepID=A0AAQ6IQP7_ANATE
MLRQNETEEQTVSQMRKEMYKQELLKQIAEQRKNKIREKKLELRVAATGATDPEKEVAEWHNYRDKTYSFKPIEETEHGGPQGRSQVISGTALSQLTGKIVRGPGAVAPQGVPSLDFLTEDYHRDFSNMLGEMAIPRVASFPPSVPPGVTNNYITPFDAAYYYYGTRNPLEPHLPNYQSISLHPYQFNRKMYILRNVFTLLPITGSSSLDVGKALADKSKQRRESVLSYQEALRRQIKEREEHNRREKEEKTQYDAKIEAEMMAYNPWGRSGGGAPIKDQKGNLFSKLGFALLNRIYCFSDLPTPQQLDMQERYKEALKQQIEENKRKQAEEKEQMRIEEEKEEKRLMEQRARIQREYEEEQRKQKKIEVRKVEKTIPESPKDIEEKKATQRNVMLLTNLQREPSPPIPTLLKKQTNPVVSRPSSVASQLSTRTVGHLVMDLNISTLWSLVFLSLHLSDTASREEVLHMYPDPPTDAPSLDIQQQVLLREQQRQIRRMKKEEEHGQKEPGRFIHRGSMLPSETTFMGKYGLFVKTVPLLYFFQVGRKCLHQWRHTTHWGIFLFLRLQTFSIKMTEWSGTRTLTIPH